MAPQAQKSLQGVRSECQRINQILAQVERDAGNGKETSQLEELEEHLRQLRFHAMATYFVNLKFAHEQGVEDKLWHAHVSVNTAYRHSIKRLKGSNQALHGGQRPVVLLRQAEKLYSAHLREAQYFYKGFISRLAATFELPQLQRIADRTQSDTMSPENPERADAHALNVHAEVMKSCYNTLLHLGDLSRYRMKQSRNKKPSPDNGLAYYGLAHELMPTSGNAHHQMAVIYADDKKDFEVVYHFYLSLAVNEPHPNAAKNLAAEFSQLLAGGSQRNGNAPINPQQTFATWFIRLHARFSKGETFQQQDELEKEVLHRLELLLKTPESLPLLTKAIIINIAAYDVARKKVQGEWTISGSQSCQFILRFHARMMLAIARALLPGLDEALASVRPETGESGSVSFNTGLPLIRICLAWMDTCRDDIIDYKQYLEPYVSDMHRALTLCLTEFVRALEAWAAKRVSFSSTPYLLPEDVEIVGLSPLQKWEALFEETTGNPKPRFDDSKLQEPSPGTEILGRVYDIVKSLVILTKDGRFPYKTNQASSQGMVVAYVEDYQPQVLVDQAQEMPTVLVATRSPEAKEHPARHPIIHRTGQQPPPQVNAHHSQRISAATAFTDQDGSQPMFGVNSTEVDIPVDDEILNRLGEFLVPPEAPTRQRKSAEHESSYGMHTATAEDVFGQVPQQSPTTRPVPSLPWEAIYNPTPYRPEMLSSPIQGGTRGHGQPASSKSSRSYDGFVENHPGQSTSSRPTNSSNRSLPRVPDANWAFVNDAESSIRMERQESNPAPRPTGTLDTAAMQRSVSSSLPQRVQATAPNAAQRLDPWAQYKNNGYGYSAAAAFPTPFTSTNFSAPSSGSLPPVQSPYGLPAAQQVPSTSVTDNYNLSSQQSTLAPQHGAAVPGPTSVDGHWSHTANAGFWGDASLAGNTNPNFGGSMANSPGMSDFNGRAREVLLSMLDNRKPRG